jgi:septal ring factor EnvC (AmiA/AmiB activator)
LTQLDGERVRQHQQTLAALTKERASLTARAKEIASLQIKAAAAFRGDLPWPAEGIVMSRFGRQKPVNGVALVRNGIEISLAEGHPVTAVHEGVVSFAGPFTGYGTLVIVEHGERTHSLYGHLGMASVKQGDRVTPETRVGTSGRNPSGNPSLYFELRVDGKPVDPLQWLRKP